ncbi:MAG TPA: Crp/Fnr family transcriptional regulator [Flavisolibacter sp.]|nr:Crp/Fnr family transcriptional regulator [Flavisolibacter sp.]
MQEVLCNLGSCFLCSSCIPEWKEAVAVKKRTFQYKRGQNIFKKGDKVTGIYFIYEGSVKVYKPWGDLKQLILRFAKAGDILGHRGLGGDEVYPITATAMEDTKACFITNSFLEATLKTNSSFTYKLMHFYAHELQRAEKRMRNLAHMEVKGRIADALLELASVFGQDPAKYIAASVTRQDIASYAGTTYETVFKFFNELTAAKIISTTGKSIKINNSNKLKQFITAA